MSPGVFSVLNLLLLCYDTAVLGEGLHVSQADGHIGFPWGM